MLPILHQKFQYLMLFSDKILPKYLAIFGQKYSNIEYHSDSRNGNESNTNINISEEIFEYSNIHCNTVFYSSEYVMYQKIYMF